MFRLSREVRIGVNPFIEGPQNTGEVTNGFGGYPTLLGIGHFLRLEVSVVGELRPDRGYMVNIKDIDVAVRDQALPMLVAFIRRGRFGGGGQMLLKLFEQLKDAWTPNQIHHLRLSLSPTLSLKLFASEYPMVRLSQKFEFCASHRLHNPALGDEENRKLFGKCNNPLGHGHNYVVQVTLAGKPDDNGLIMDIPNFERVVTTTVIEPLDHRNLNLEIPQFKELNPSVENIAMVIYRMLKPKLAEKSAQLVGVTVWETERTWCEYME